MNGNYDSAIENDARRLGVAVALSLVTAGLAVAVVSGLTG